MNRCEVVNGGGPQPAAHARQRTLIALPGAARSDQPRVHKLSRVHDPISYFQAVILGLTQGIAEPFPVSSLGHGVVLPRLFGWNIHQNDKFFLTFLIATHLATAIVLLLFFLKDWVRIVKGLWRSLQMREIRADDTRRAPGLAARRRHDPRRRDRPAAAGTAAQTVRLGRRPPRRS